MKTFYKILVLFFFSQYCANAQKVQSITTKGWNGSAWQNGAYVTYSYDANFYNTATLYQNWNAATSSYTNWISYTYTNNAMGSPSLNLTQMWNASVNTWSNSSISTTYYNSVNASTMQLGQSWNGSAWQNGTQLMQSYTNNYLTSMLYQSWNATTSTYTNSYLYTFTNNINGNPTASALQLWNSAANTWTNSSLTTHSYNAANSQTMQNSQGWNGTSWQNTSQQILKTYDANNFLISSLTQNINLSNSTYTNVSNVTYTNDAGGHPLTALTQYWNPSVSTWSNSSLQEYTYLNTPPTVITGANAAGVTPITADCSGTVTADGGASISTRGVCWSTSPAPVISDHVAASGTGTGSFTVTLTGLMPNTLYYARAFATNSAGTTYGSDLSFTTTAQEALGLNGAGSLQTLQRIEAYPLPAGDYVNIKCTASLSGVRYTVYNTSGEAILSGVFDHDDNKIRIMHLSAGVYILKTAHSATRIVKE